MREARWARAHARLMSVRVRVRARTGSLWRREPECVGVWEKAKKKTKRNPLVSAKRKGVYVKVEVEAQFFVFSFGILYIIIII
jgi:hypothetical protein